MARAFVWKGTETGGAYLMMMDNLHAPSRWD